MKKSYIYFLAMVMSLGAVSCNSDDPNDATEKHVYAEEEAPYLRADASATNAITLEFQMAKIDEPFYINLKDYAPSFHKNLDMTVDETLAALRNGEVVLYNINSSRQRWDLTPPNNTFEFWCGTGLDLTEKRNFTEYGWFYNTNGICGMSDAIFSTKLDKTAKQIVLETLNEPQVGDMCSIDFGFAIKNGTDFDKYVRFSVAVSVTDPSKVVLNANIPHAGYDVYSINLKQYEESIQLAMGMSYDEFMKAFENDLIDVYMVDANGNRVTNSDGSRPDYTSGWLGYWLDSDLSITGWDGNGYPANLMFLEYGGGGIYNLGNSASITPSGTQCKLTFDFVSVEDPNAFLSFIIAVTFD